MENKKEAVASRLGFSNRRRSCTIKRKCQDTKIPEGIADLL
jgi:hypothetical protein